MRKSAFAALLIALLICAWPLTAAASLVLDRDDPPNPQNAPGVGAGAGAGTGAGAGAGTGTGQAQTNVPTPARIPGIPETAMVAGGLIETFDVLLGLYEQTFEIGRSFTSNVPNGARTHDGVFLHFPGNMRIRAERDGVGFTYTNRSLLTDAGSYTFVVTSPGVLSGETTGVFTFRILPPHPAGIERAGEDGVARPRVREFFSESSGGGANMIEYTFLNHRRFFANVADGETIDVPAFFILPPNAFGELRRNGVLISLDNNRLYTEVGNYVLTVNAPSYVQTGRRAIVPYTVISFSIAPGTDVPGGVAAGVAAGAAAGAAAAGGWMAGLLTPGADADPDPDVQIVIDPLTQLTEDGGYLQIFSDGRGFFSSVGAGSVTQGPVRFEIPDGMFYELNHNEVFIPYTSGDEIAQPGVYRLAVHVYPQGAGEPRMIGLFEFTITEQADEDEAVPVMAAPPADDGDAFAQDDTDIVSVTADEVGIDAEYELDAPRRLNMTAILFIVLVVLLLAGGGLYFLQMRKNSKV